MIAAYYLNFKKYIIIMNLNYQFFYLINNNLQNPLFDFIMPHLTNIGGFAGLLVLCIIAIILTKYYKKEKYLKIAKLCLYSLILSGIITLCLKLAIVEQRPFLTLSNVHQLVTPTEPNSFPSGHASSTLSVATVLIYEFRKNKLIVAGLVIFSILIAFSRVYCGVHYPLDVLTGMMVGILSGVVILKLKV
ncbi:phosphatase PAP2 family protein [Methanobrevibacter sp. YE315]|uniref:phosphatase PAP2 family protein n=1 Tax=Methanobrevibacter sp. YE315 TaxID=1609968 RepID=UPI0009EB3847|nr:phosphatase PAP2 family protein [Methanobrevibacter sp. YE315]